MHHYKHHIGDFRSKTGHLSNEEELAYRRMIEVYYDTEEPLPASVEWIARRVRIAPDVVERVLDDFFDLDGDVWRQSRCDRELAEYRKAVRLARANGKRGGRPPKQTGTEPEPGRNRPGSLSDTDPGGESKAPQPPTPVPQPPSGTSVPPPRSSEGAGGASHEEGIGERGGDPREREAIFALLCATGLRSKSKNQRQILDEIAGAVWADGMIGDQARRLIAKARVESKGDPAGLIDRWFRPGTWREKWGELVSGKVAGTVARLASARRA